MTSDYGGMPPLTQLNIANPHTHDTSSTTPGGTLKAICFAYNDDEYQTDTTEFSKDASINSTDISLACQNRNAVALAQLLKQYFKYPQNSKQPYYYLENFVSAESENTKVFDQSTVCNLVKDCYNHLIQDGDLDPTSNYYRVKNLSDADHIVVIGDTHGSLHSLCDIIHHLNKTQNVIDDYGTLRKNCYIICLGDMLDRSAYSLETLVLFLTLFAKNPTQVFITQGNHENDLLMHEHYGFSRELRLEYNVGNSRSFCSDPNLQNLLSTLPMSLIALTPIGQIQFNHGSFESEFEFGNFTEGILSTVTQYSVQPLIWGDLAADTISPEELAEHTSNTGRPTNTASELKTYLNTNRMNMLIRGHQDKNNVSLLYDDTVTTLPHNLDTGFEQYEDDFDMWLLNTSSNKYMEKPLYDSKWPSLSKGIDYPLAVTTSTAVYSKYDQKFQNMNTYLLISKNKPPVAHTPSPSSTLKYVIKRYDEHSIYDKPNQWSNTWTDEYRYRHNLHILSNSVELWEIIQDILSHVKYNSKYKNEGDDSYPDPSLASMTTLVGLERFKNFIKDFNVPIQNQKEDIADLSQKERIIVIGDSNGYLHSVCEILQPLIKPNTDELIEGVHVICLGNVLIGTAYGFDTFCLFLRLLKNNPDNVTLLCGTKERSIRDDYSNYKFLIERELDQEYIRNYKKLILDLIVFIKNKFNDYLVAITKIGIVQFGSENLPEVWNYSVIKDNIVENKNNKGIKMYIRGHNQYDNRLSYYRLGDLSPEIVNEYSQEIYLENAILVTTSTPTVIERVQYTSWLEIS